MQSRIVVLVVLLVGLAAAVVLATVGGDDAESEEGTKPTVEVSDAPPPEELEVDDLTVGDGPEAEEGDNVSVRYVGVRYSDGGEFDSNWDDPQTFDFEIGAGGVIPGWDEGIPGMKVGGRRELIIPPDLGYGEAGRPPDIPPNETLVFVVDLLGVR